VQVATRRLDVDVAEKHLSENRVAGLVIESLCGRMPELVHREMEAERPPAVN
jgi:hypothetical protein